MQNQRDELFEVFIEECKEHLSSIETDLLALESVENSVDQSLINKIFRAAHTIKGSAAFFGIEKVKKLSHAMESILGQLRDQKLTISNNIFNSLLESADLLSKIFENINNLDQFDISECLNNLYSILPEDFNQTTDFNKEKPQPVIYKCDFNLPFSNNEKGLTFTIEDFEILSKQEKAGSYIYGLQIINQDCKANKTPEEILPDLDQIAAIGEKLSHQFTDKDKGIDYLEWIVLCSTVIEPELFHDVLGLPSERVLLLYSKNNLSNVNQNITPSQDLNTQGQQMSPKDNNNKSDNSGTSKNENNSIRISLTTLDKLMTLAGELVLARNSLVSKVHSKDQPALNFITQQIDSITTELQESIMATRMQTVSFVFMKFKRVVRDLSQKLGKKINLQIEGEDVELDKTIIEAISDPLTHLVRNSIDHGIEFPHIRTANGKNEQGTIILKAYHESGQVIIEIQDDGAGINSQKVKQKAIEQNIITPNEAQSLTESEIIKLIFKPGFSTATEVTEISGRGVGMDVVATNLSKVNGVVDVKSEINKGTKIIIRLPLTLAIVPALLIRIQNEKFAIPHVNLSEMIKFKKPTENICITSIGASNVLKLRGELIPLLYLTDLIGIQRTFIDPKDGVEKVDKRKLIGDRRNSLEHIDSIQNEERRKNSDRRIHTSQKALNIAVVATGSNRFALVVDEFLDNEEIVIKPLGIHFQDCSEYAGATILGDGNVALVLDIGGLYTLAGISNVNSALEKIAAKQNTQVLNQDAQSYLLLQDNNSQQYAVPLGTVSRIQKFTSNSIIDINGKKAVYYENKTIGLMSIHDILPRTQNTQNQLLTTAILFKAYGRDTGLLVSDVTDIVESSAPIDFQTFSQKGILGSVVIHNKMSLIIDIYSFVDSLFPEYKNTEKSKTFSGTILVVEDSAFFQKQMVLFLQDEGFKVLYASNGQEGLNLLLDKENAIDLIITDIEMPIMDGLEMTRQIRGIPEFKSIPIIAVTSLSGNIAEKQGREAGLNDYLVKLDREQIRERISHHLKSKRPKLVTNSI